MILISINQYVPKCIHGAVREDLVSTACSERAREALELRIKKTSIAL